MLRVAGGDNKLLSRLFNAMGVVLSVQSEYDQGLEYFQKALIISEKVLNKEHPQVAYNLNNIGVVLWRLKKYDQAFKYYQRALKIDENALGLTHPNPYQIVLSRRYGQAARQWAIPCGLWFV